MAAQEHSKVVLYRMQTNCGPVVDTPAASTGKRKFNTAPEKCRRQYEFVNVQRLNTYVRAHMPSKKQDPILQFCAMVAMCGCDFVMNLPRIGPKTAWKFRHRWQHLNLLQPAEILFAMNLIYYDMFVMKNGTAVLLHNSVHSGNSSERRATLDEGTSKASYEHTIQRVKNNIKTSQLVRSSLWTGERALAHAKNTSWTLQYWQNLQCFVCPHSSDFGYTRDVKGRTVFAFAPGM
jgi:hypothetical protein